MNTASLRHFYSNKRVWLTGHTGFKGGWLAYWLTLMGAKVGGYALAPEANRPSFFELLKLEDKIERSQIAHICDAEVLRAAMVDFRPDIVIHMAAQPLVRYSFRNPLETYATNVLGTANVLEATRYCDAAKAVVCITTDKCYENYEWVWPYRETDRLGGYDPYSSSKACAEIVAAAWRRSFFQEPKKALATARAGNVVGGGDFSEDRIIPDFIAALQRSETLVIRSPGAIRPWQHVLDALHGYLRLGQQLYEQGDAYAEAFNFSPDDSATFTVQQMIDILIRKTGKGSYTIDEAQRTVHEATFLRLDSHKARAKLQWKVLLPMEACLDFTAAWYDVYLRGASVEKITEEQIAAFEALAG